MRTLVIFASARAQGNTRRVLDNVLQSVDWPVVDLATKRIAPYNYAHEYAQDDEFMDVMAQVFACDHLVLATPIYWYHVSTPMKVFLDRITDLLTAHKALGRQLRGKTLSVICAYGEHPSGKEGFQAVMQQIADYLGMHFGHCYHQYTGEGFPDLKTPKPLEDFLAFAREHAHRHPRCQNA